MSDKVLTADLIVDFLLDGPHADDLARELQASEVDARKLWVDAVAVAEACRLLALVDPPLPPRTIADALARFLVLSGIRSTEREALLNALDEYGRTDRSFPEAWWTQQAVLFGASILPATVHVGDALEKTE
ncbi:hypothetical protein [Alicyclobacillus sp. SP_1]|jgi:hypothetical protein|uniref:hypothetical protein n=1 Tax=Alicyclobacillus sp. SP_1 TaxID=2942475 RepID=UPI002157EA18|nr:hypothetical protein [Alicyclobacillus sp. SP_1]